MTEGGENKKERRGIKFNPKIGVALIMSLEEYTPEECVMAWFQADEYGKMEDECEFTSDFLQNKKMLPPALCGRGLECWTVEGEDSKDKHVSLAVELVWQAQLKQWKNKGEYEGMDFIRQEYEEITVPCHEAAHTVGLKDELEVKRYLAPIKNMEKTRKKMQSLLSKNHKHGGGANNNNDDATGVPKLKPAIITSSKNKTPKQTSRKARSASPDSCMPSPVRKKMGGLDLLDKIERRLTAEPNTPKSGSKGLSNNSCGVAASPDRSVKKIVFRPKGRSKVPLSPVGSLHGAGEFSSGSRRHFASQKSVCTEDGSVRRRMLKATSTLKL